MRHPYIYILASRRNGTLYIGVTSQLSSRIFDHKQGVGSVFTRKYGVTRLVWAEAHETMESAFTRERQLKAWRRKWKLELIERSNPDWRDFYDDHQIE